MGTPKALLDIDGDALLTHVARAVAPTCDPLVLSVGTADDASPAFVARLERAVHAAGATRVTTVRDPVPRMGPVGGLAASLPRAEGEWAFVTGCDSPFLWHSFVAGLAAYATEDVDVVLPIRAGRPEPLLALYRVETMARHFESQLADGGGSPVARLDAVRVARVEGDGLRALDPDGRSFTNVNDPDDYARALRTRTP